MVKDLIIDWLSDKVIYDVEDELFGVEAVRVAEQKVKYQKGCDMIKHEHENHFIYQGDAIEMLENEIKDSSIDLIFVDPPYNIGKDFNGLKDKWATDELYLEVLQMD